MLLCVYMLCAYLGVLYFGCSAHCKWRVGGRKGVARLLLLVVDLLSGCVYCEWKGILWQVAGEVTIVHGTSLRFLREKSFALVFWSSRRSDYFSLFSYLVRLVGLAVKGPCYQRGFLFAGQTYIANEKIFVGLRHWSSGMVTFSGFNLFTLETGLAVPLLDWT